MVKNISLNFFTRFIRRVIDNSVNRLCWFYFYQPEEPKEEEK